MNNYNEQLLESLNSIALSIDSIQIPNTNNLIILLLIIICILLGINIKMIKILTENKKN